MRYKTLNLKEYEPSVEQAIAIVELEIECSKKEGYYAIKIIHGYGSHGVGGVIKKELLKWKNKAIRQHKILSYVKGENWSDTNPTVQKIKQICPEVIGDFELFNSNAGVSVILISNGLNQ